MLVPPTLNKPTNDPLNTYPINVVHWTKCLKVSTIGDFRASNNHATNVHICMKKYVKIFGGYDGCLYLCCVIKGKRKRVGQRDGASLSNGWASLVYLLGR